MFHYCHVAFWHTEGPVNMSEPIIFINPTLTDWGYTGLMDG